MSSILPANTLDWINSLGLWWVLASVILLSLLPSFAWLVAPGNSLDDVESGQLDKEMGFQYRLVPVAVVVGVVAAKSAGLI